MCLKGSLGKQIEILLIGKIISIWFIIHNELDELLAKYFGFYRFIYYSLIIWLLLNWCIRIFKYYLVERKNVKVEVSLVYFLLAHLFAQQNDYDNAYQCANRSLILHNNDNRYWLLRSYIIDELRKRRSHKRRKKVTVVRH